ncbi:MAG: SAM-dependent chlorinase/fluorinase [Bacteroidetes bacterium]|nr:SAM-dependent chlorinase/fluorinase [Bacteroidota bacterium]
MKDHYLASVKGAILRLLPEVNVVDISHEVSPFNIKEAAYIFRNAWQYFPEGTVHILGVDTEESDNQAHVVIKNKGHFFIGADNGIFSLIFNEVPDECRELQVMQDSDYFTFPTRDRFVKTAVHLVKGESMDELGPIHGRLLERSLFNPVIETDAIKGVAIYIDRYENVITNITREVFEKVRKGRKCKIVIRGEVIPQISESYSDVNFSFPVALFGSNGHLEIALNRGNAGGLLGLNIDSSVRVEFF